MTDTMRDDDQLSEILALDAAGEYSDCGDTLRALSAALERAERERDEARDALEKVRREERERCAKVAEEWRDKQEPLWIGADYRCIIARIARAALAEKGE